MKSTSTTGTIVCLVLSLLSWCQGGAYVPTVGTSTSSGSRHGALTGGLFPRVSLRHVTVDEDFSFTDKEGHDKKEKKKSRQGEYEQRRQEWMERYGSLEALQSTFGTGGDLSPEQTRRLYHALLPRSLLGLYEWKLMNPEELAPMAYHARMAAKQYARSRSVWYARAFTAAVDQYRNLRNRRWGKSASMTWEEIWSKYEAQIVREECADELLQTQSSEQDTKPKKQKQKQQQTKEFKEKDLTMRIYLRILEKSCATNQAFDAMFLTTTNNTDELDGLSQMGQQLELDVREILLGPKESAKVTKKVAKQDKKETKERQKEEHELEKLELKQQKQRLKTEKKRIKELEKQTKPPGLAQDDMDEEENNDQQLPITPKSQSWEVLRILAGTRRKFRRIFKGLI